MRIRAHFAVLLAAILAVGCQTVAQAGAGSNTSSNRYLRHGYENYPPRYPPRFGAMPSSRYYQGSWYGTRATPSNRYFQGSWYNPYSDGALPSSGSPYWFGW